MISKGKNISMPVNRCNTLKIQRRNTDEACLAYSVPLPCISEREYSKETTEESYLLSCSCSHFTENI